MIYFAHNHVIYDNMFSYGLSNTMSVTCCFDLLCYLELENV